MNKYYIYIGIALAIVIIALFVFRAELSAIVMPTLDTAGGETRRIMSITGDGAIILSDNTVTDINAHIASIRTDLTNDISGARQTLNQRINGVVSTQNADRTAAADTYQPVGDYLKNKDKVAFSSSLAAGPASGFCRRGASGVGDCRAIVSMFNPKQNNDSRWKEQENDELRFRIDSSGGWKNGPVRDGKIYLVRADP